MLQTLYHDTAQTTAEMHGLRAMSPLSQSSSTPSTSSSSPADEADMEASISLQGILGPRFELALQDDSGPVLERAFQELS